MRLFLYLMTLSLAAAQPVVAAKLLGHWDFDEAHEGLIRDRSGHGHDGRIHGAPRFVDGIAGTALRFGSNEDYVDFGAPLIPARDFTIAVWLNCDDTDKQFFLGQYLYQHPRRLDLAVREGCVRIQIDEIVDSPKLIEARKWYHLAYTRTGGQLRIYVNGELITEAMLPGEVIQTENLMIGKIVVPHRDSFRFTGSIDELKIWDAALAPPAIKQLYVRHAPPAP